MPADARRIMGGLELAAGVAGMGEFSALTIALIGAVVFVAYIVRGMSGFGTSLVAIPILAFILPLHTAVPLMTLIGLSVTIILGIRDRQHVRWDEMLRLLPPTLVGVVAGIYLFTALDARLMQRLLGGFIVVYAVYMIASQFIRTQMEPCSSRWAWPAGFGSAFIDSMFGGGGGPLVVIYMHRRGYEPVTFRSTLAVLWLVELVVRVGGYAVGGYYRWGVVLTALVLLPVMWLGNRTGEAISRRMSQRTFARLIAAVLFASGVSLLLK